MMPSKQSQMNGKVRFCVAPGFRYAASGLLAISHQAIYREVYRNTEKTKCFRWNQLNDFTVRVQAPLPHQLNWAMKIKRNQENHESSHCRLQIWQASVVTARPVGACRP